MDKKEVATFTPETLKVAVAFVHANDSLVRQCFVATTRTTNAELIPVSTALVFDSERDQTGFQRLSGPQAGLTVATDATNFLRPRQRGYEMRDLRGTAVYRTSHRPRPGPQRNCSAPRWTRSASQDSTARRASASTDCWGKSGRLGDDV